MKHMVTRFIFFFCLLWVGPIQAQDVQSDTSPKQITQAVSLEYLRLDAKMDYAELQQLYADEATFFDPTGDVFEGAVARGVVRGAAQIIELQRGWGLNGIDFKPKESFYFGQYAIHRGTFNALFEGSSSWIPIPFVTIHRVVNGKVQSRMDFGEYIKSFGLGSQFDAATKTTEAVANEYLQAYLDKDFAAQAALMADSVTFQDPTASAFGPGSGIPIHGSEALILNRKQVFKTITNFGFDVAETFVSNHHKVFMGTVKYTTGNGMKFAQPAVFIVEVRNGKVTQHWDFVDYSIPPIG